ncbi:MAG: SGNH/GDSL hydrolase family protein [Anaerolineae bacterium]|nr:SGNH/GDSL hydrolase family protein [Anaerolineae bacterium]MDW8173022.1 SGNH/GDSL hydrolase family protein [Anaerolineae bacterium]
MRLVWLMLAGCVLSLGLIRADEAPLTTSAHRQAVLFAGPGETHPQLGLLAAGLEVQLVARNQAGTWLKVQRLGRDGQVAQEGWLISGLLNMPPDLRYSNLPVADLPDAVPQNVRSRSLRRLYAYPVLPVFDKGMRAVYERGQALGRRADTFTKVGDSVSASGMYLEPMAQGNHVLGPHDDLEAVIAYYGPQASPSVAAQVGLTSYAIFDPFWAAQDLCQPNETPLACEYRLKNPALAFILFGANDARHMTDVQYDEQLRLIVDETLNAGIVPILSTFSVHPEDDLWWQKINLNLRIVALAEEKRLPLINFWSAARILPQYGLDQDRVHLLQTGFGYLKYDNFSESWYGAALQNLLALRTLQLWQKFLLTPP